jgi:hypothetical protein
MAIIPKEPNEIARQNDIPKNGDVKKEIEKYLMEKDASFYQVDNKTLPSASTILSNIPKANISIELVRYDEEKDERGTKITVVVVAKRKLENGETIQIPEIVSFYAEDKIQAQLIRALRKRAQELYDKGKIYSVSNYVVSAIKDNNLDAEAYLILKDLELRTRLFASRIAITQAQARAVAKLLSYKDWMTEEEKAMEEDMVQFVNEEYIPQSSSTPQNEKPRYLDKQFPIFKQSLKNLQKLYSVNDEEYHEFLNSHGFEHSTEVPPDERNEILTEFKKFCETKKKVVNNESNPNTTKTKKKVVSNESNNENQDIFTV